MPLVHPILYEGDMTMAENKTKPTQNSVTTFLNSIQDRALREDCFAIAAMMQKVSKLEPVMWGSAIVGFGLRHYVYESGREGDTVIIGFSPRKQNIAIYLQGGTSELGSELAALGKHKTGKGCLYIKISWGCALGSIGGRFCQSIPKTRAEEQPGKRLMIVVEHRPA